MLVLITKIILSLLVLWMILVVIIGIIIVRQRRARRKAEELRTAQIRKQVSDWIAPPPFRRKQ